MDAGRERHVVGELTVVTDRQVEVERDECADSNVGRSDHTGTDNRSLADRDVTTDDGVRMLHDGETSHMRSHPLYHSSLCRRIPKSNDRSYVRMAREPIGAAEHFQVVYDRAMFTVVVVEEAERPKRRPFCVDVLDPLAALAAEPADADDDYIKHVFIDRFLSENRLLQRSQPPMNTTVASFH
jgi:hypothetical protein